MQTQLADFIKDTHHGQEAEQILRACVHCGFCNATCPTYQILGDELDGPRGRIYLMKQVMEGATPTVKTLTHLDRCLTCRNCETTCPSGVAYGRLVDIGREVVEAQVQRPVHARALRWVLRQVLSRRSLFTPLLRTGQLLRPLAPAPLKRQIPPRVAPGPRPAATHARKMLILDGCVQPGIAPLTNAATARVLDRLGIEVVTAAGAGCCGAVSHHLSAADEARDYMRRNIDAWWPQVEAGAEAIIMTASGCGAVVKDYGQILADDPAYAEKAARIAGLTKDLSEILGQEDLSALGRPGEGRRIAFHPPCSLQHAQQLKGVVEPILEGIGFELLPIRDAHLCCGSAGTYSILQETLSQELLARKLENLQAPRPELIATANIGCQAHLASRAGVPVIHWISLLDEVGAAA